MVLVSVFCGIGFIFVADLRMPFFYAEYYSTLWIYLSVGGRLEYSYILAIKMSAVNIHKQVIF